MEELDKTGEETRELAIASPLPLDRHPLAVYLARLMPTSRRTMHEALDIAIRELTGGECDAMGLDWSLLGYQHTMAIRAAMVERGYAPSTVNRTISAIRGVLKECWRLGYIRADQMQRVGDIEPVRGVRLPAGRYIHRLELKQLVEACERDKSARGARDAALLATLYSTGMRNAEITRLDLADYDRKTGEIKVRSGKGNKDRLVYANEDAMGYIESWLAFRGEAPGHLFNWIHYNGRVFIETSGKSKSTGAGLVRRVVRTRGTEAGVAHCRAHDFRRKNISDLLGAGVDLVTVQKLAGHSDPRTTAGYDRRLEETRREAVAKLQRLHGDDGVDVAPSQGESRRCPWCGHLL